MDLLSALITALALLAVLPAATAPEGDALTEPVAKAAVLYNLATYASWPEERASLPELVIGVAGPDPVLDALATVQGDGPAAQRAGTGVRVFFEGPRLKLEIELTAVERASVRISSKVLTLARVLRNGNVDTPLTPP